MFIIEPMTGLDKAINYFGSQSSMAKALGLTPMAVSNWKKRGIPAERVLSIEEATHGAVTRLELRPDLYRESAA